MKPKEVKAAEARQREALRVARTPAQQVQELDRRLGLRRGAKKERRRLEGGAQ